jgi:Meiotically up-regulated gene 113
MPETADAIHALADTLANLGAPYALPEDWIILCDNDDLCHMPRTAARKLLAQAKKETARRWLYERFDPSEMDRELSEDVEYGADAEEFDDRQLKRHAINSIDDVMSTVNFLREAYATLASSSDASAAHEATVAARVQFGYPKERPNRTDCFDEDARRQCRRIINEIYSATEKSSGPVVYLVSTDNPEFVKIGFTTCLERRLRSLRTASHIEPTIHLTIPGTPSLERELHTRFGAARYNREWFRLTDEIRTFIASERGIVGPDE